MAAEPKKHVLLYPFDINKMKREIPDEKHYYVDLCYLGTKKMCAANMDLRRFQELNAIERNDYLTNSFIVLFAMYLLTTIVVIGFDAFCVGLVNHKISFRFKTHIGIGLKTFIALTILFCILLNFLLCLINSLQRMPFSIFMNFLELCVKTCWICLVGFIFRTHIVLVYCITFTIFTLFCVSLGSMSEFDYRQGTHLILLGFVMAFISLVVSFVTFSVTCQTIDLAVVGLCVMVCMGEYVFLVIQMSLIIYGFTMELTKYEYMIGAYLLYSPVINIFMSTFRVFSVNFNTIELPEKETKGIIPNSKRIYIWNSR